MKTFIRSTLIIFAGLFLAGAGSAAHPQEMPSDYQEALKYLGKKGDYKDNVLKVNIPRNDLKVTVEGIATPPPFGFGGWVAMTKGNGGMDVMMGDLVLLQEEANPVMSALLDHGLEVTALHNHFFWEQPRLFYMHVHGRGKALDLAQRVKFAVDLIGRGSSHPGSGTPGEAGGAPPPSAALDTAKIAQIVGHQGEQMGSVYKITIGRDDLDLKDMGATIKARMGLNTWAAFVGSNGNAAVAGDVAMLENEVTQVLKALRGHGLDVVSVHQHMLGTHPTIIFLHYWGRGPAEKLATGFKAALDQLGKRSDGMKM